MKLNWPLMRNNITRADLDVVIEFLQGDPILTQSKNVREFEKEWCDWLGVKYSVFLNSGSSANFITLATLKARFNLDGGEIVVPPFTWVSDVASVLQAGFKPVFADVNPRTMCMDTDRIIEKLSPRTRAVFMTYAQGFNGLTDRLLAELEKRNIPLIEDVCESHGATFKGRRLGSYGLVSNFSYYFAHHMSTIEGGMICTNDEQMYQIARMYRSHGMVRECTDENLRKKYAADNPELNPQFIFAFPGYNMRSTEINAVLGRNQLKRLDANNKKRYRNFEIFLNNLDPQKYQTDFDLEGSCNYALNLVMRKADAGFVARLMAKLDECAVEYRRGSAGGGNQLRQPYLRGIVPADEYQKHPVTDHIHFYGFYIGNFPELEEDKILALCKILNAVE